jgi:hypothetical protein
MTERQKDIWAGCFMAALFVVIPFAGRLVLRLMLRYT